MHRLLVVVLGVPEVYESLYRTGYHRDTRLTHARGVLSRIAHSTSVLDVGCSHGYAVQALWSRGIRANGVDISPTAVRLAFDTRGTGNCGDDPCSQVGRATSLPFADKTLDTLLSTDVLEHLAPEEVDRAAREMARVTRRDMWLKIATREERDRAPLQNLHRRRAHTNVHRLHRTVMDPESWAARFGAVARNATVTGDLVHVML